MAIEFKLQLNPRLGNITDEAIEQALESAAIIVQSNAKALAPVSPGGGDLRKNIFREVTEEEAIVYDTMEYAPYQEFGTVKMKAQSFLRPAAYGSRKKILATMADVMKRKL